MDNNKKKIHTHDIVLSCQVSHIIILHDSIWIIFILFLCFLTKMLRCSSQPYSTNSASNICRTFLRWLLFCTFLCSLSFLLTPAWHSRVSSSQVVVVGHLCELNYLDTVRTKGRKRESVELRSSNLLWLSSLYVLRFYIYVSSSSHLSSIVCCFCSHLFTISFDAIHQPFSLSHGPLCHSCKERIFKLEWWW